MRTTKTTSREVVIDDLTGEEILSGGWELCGISGRHDALHFQTLTGLCEALVTKGTIFGLTNDQFMIDNTPGLSLKR